MLDCHINTWLLKPCKIMRKKMKDLTVGHVFLLEACKSPFLRGGNITLHDMALLVLLCSLDFADAVDFLMQPEKKIFNKVSAWGYWCRLFRVDFEEAQQQCVEYVNAYTDMPEMWKDKDEKKNTSALPFSLKIAWTLMAKMTEAQAWNCQFSRALAYYTAEAEYNGQRFVTEEQKKIIDKEDR